jgi:hypothetical protein
MMAGSVTWLDFGRLNCPTLFGVPTGKVSLMATHPSLLLLGLIWKGRPATAARTVREPLHRVRTQPGIVINILLTPFIQRCCSHMLMKTHTAGDDYAVCHGTKMNKGIWFSGAATCFVAPPWCTSPE